MKLATVVLLLPHCQVNYYAWWSINYAAILLTCDLLCGDLLCMAF